MMEPVQKPLNANVVAGKEEGVHIPAVEISHIVADPIKGSKKYDLLVGGCQSPREDFDLFSAFDVNVLNLMIQFLYIIYMYLYRYS